VVVDLVVTTSKHGAVLHAGDGCRSRQMVELTGAASRIVRIAREPETALVVGAETRDRRTVLRMRHPIDVGPLTSRIVDRIQEVVRVDRLTASGVPVVTITIEDHVAL